MDTIFRDYSNVSDAVKENYLLARTNQTVEFVDKMVQKYSTFDKKIKIWDILDSLNTLIDVSDPDMSLPNIEHAYQTAEKIRQDGHPDWMQLVGLIHDMGKIMYLKGTDETGTGKKKQWAMVGDTFIVGCKLPDTLIFPEFNKYHLDKDNPLYNTELGIYKEGCGLDNVKCSWGHDEYLYRILTDSRNSNTLPEEALYIIRFHSLYAYHDKKSYNKFMSEKDKQMINYLTLFNQYDLYSKSDICIDKNQVRLYYNGLMEKYFKNSYLYI